MWIYIYSLLSIILYVNTKYITNLWRCGKGKYVINVNNLYYYSSTIRYILINKEQWIYVDKHQKKFVLGNEY